MTESVTYPPGTSNIVIVPGPVGPVGPQGPQGATGATGPGVAVGGTTGQVLTKINATDYNTNWQTPAAGLTLPLTQNLTFSPDNSSDIGASGANRPRNVYVGTSVVTPLLDTPLLAPAGNVIEQRNGTSGQTLRIYNTTDAGTANYERLSMFWFTNAMWLETQAGGTGVARNLNFRAAANLSLIGGGGLAGWYVSTTGQFLGQTDNSYDIGAAGGRPRSITVGTSVVTPLLDTPLLAPTGNVIEQRNGTNAQTLRIYNTFTDASNYERGGIKWAGNILRFVADAGLGTGANREVFLGTEGLAATYVVTGNTIRWQFQPAGHLVAQADSTYDIGASGANRPHSVYVGSAYYTAMNTAAQGPGIWGGSGAPATGLGAVGDVYHRSDTPTTSLQRMYVKTAAAVWTGIV